MAASRTHVLNEQQVSERMVDVTVWSPALRGRTTVRLLLPTHYRDRPLARWPSLYLLHGCCDSYVSWTRSTDIEQLSAASDVLAVMPDGGRVGFYSDWLDGPAGRVPHRRAAAAFGQSVSSQRSTSSGRELDGGPRRPHLRLPATQGYSPRPLPSAALCTPACPATNPGPTSGSSTPRASTPTPCGGTLRGPSDLGCAQPVRPRPGPPHHATVHLRRQGQPGPLNRGGALDRVEEALHAENVAFQARLTQLGAAATFDFYGPGSHDWPYWQRELHRAWPLLTNALG